MDFLLSCPLSKFPTARRRTSNFLTSLRRVSYTVRSSSALPFPREKANYYNELEAAVDVVERACGLCVDVKASLSSSDGRILEKGDNTPVTVADFGVQALVSLEMNRLFPHIPLVAEEDSAFLCSSNLVDAVVDVVSHKATYGGQLTKVDVLNAIDRGGKDAWTFGSKPATYWVLDPIDGTRGFLKGSEALYVVGLALVVDEKIVIGVMGCPNWLSYPETSTSEDPADSNKNATTGIVMISHIGHGTWRRSLWGETNISGGSFSKWVRCSVDDCQSVQMARVCIPESQSWESLPLSASFSAIKDAINAGDQESLLLSTCCGSLCKYLLVASGRASIFIQRAKAQSTIKAWDHAVGVICVDEAGGKVTDWRGVNLDFAADQLQRRVIYPSGGILVSNETLHQLLLDMISSFHSPPLH